MKRTTILILLIITLFCSCDKTPLLSIHVIDVGQGDSILIKTPSGNNILVDAGDEDSDYIVKNYLKKERIEKIDLIIATHPDSDHIGGLDNVIDSFDIGILSMPEKASHETSYYDLLKSSKNKKLDIEYIKKDDTLNIDNDISIKVLSPSHISSDTNTSSIVFYFKFKEMEFVFTGDSESDNETDILNTYDIENIEFLKVAHHGSKTSSSENFISKLRPDISVISCGYKNQYGHPHEQTLNTLIKNESKIFRTDKLGDIVFYSDGSKIFTKKKYSYE